MGKRGLTSSAAGGGWQMWRGGGKPIYADLPSNPAVPALGFHLDLAPPPEGSGIAWTRGPLARPFLSLSVRKR